MHHHQYFKFTYFKVFKCVYLTYSFPIKIYLMNVIWPQISPLLCAVALHQEGLFRVNGNVRAVESLKHRLQSGEEVDLLAEGDVSTVASLLKQYLRDLPEGLVHSAVHNALIQQYQGRSQWKTRTWLHHLTFRHISVFKSFVFVLICSSQTLSAFIPFHNCTFKGPLFSTFETTGYNTGSLHYTH